MAEKELVLTLASKVGSREALADELGVWVSAVNNWVQRDRIGAPNRRKFRDLARQHGIRLSERWVWNADREAA